MKAQVAAVVLLGCVGLASAGILSAFGGSKVSKASKALYSGAEVKSVQQVTDELHALRMASASSKNNEYKALVDYYLAMPNLSADRCSVEQISKITRPFESAFAEFSLKGYRAHWATEQFKLCRANWANELTKAIDNLTPENKRDLEAFHTLTYQAYTAWRWQNPEWFLAHTGLKLDEAEIGDYIVYFFNTRNKEQLRTDMKTKSDEEWAQEAVKTFREITNSIFENTKSGSVPYFEVGHIPDVVDLFNDFELKWISELRTPNDMGATIEQHEAVEKRVIEETLKAYRKLKGDVEKYGI